TVYADGMGGYYEPQSAADRPDRAVWRFYHFVNHQTYLLNLQTDSASNASASRFRLVASGRWRIDLPIEFLRSPVEPYGYCTSMARTILSDITRSVAPTHTTLAQEMVDRIRGIGYTIGHGLVVWFDNVVVYPPEGLDELLGELEHGGAQI